MRRGVTYDAGRNEFQSAPAIAGGRCSGPPAGRCCAGSFNPRPPLLAGDADALLQVRLGELFQSAPAIAGGRCADGCRCRRRPRCFNPRPPLLAGDAWRGRVATAAPACFNPRPPLLAGDARHAAIDLRLELVSIRARHCWRAMRQDRAHHRRAEKFQSAPAIAGGRCGRRWWRLRWPRGFNPRPPLLAGDARPPRSARPGSMVSIRARHCWRAMPGAGAACTGWCGFQSAPAIAGGRC